MFDKLRATRKVAALTYRGVVARLGAPRTR